MAHQFNDFEYPDNNDTNPEVEEDEKQPKKDAKPKDKRPTKKTTKAVKSDFDKGIKSLSLNLVKLSSLLVGIGLLVLGGNALLAVFGIIHADLVTSPQGSPYYNIVVVPFAIMAITYGAGVFVASSLYKLLPIFATKIPMIGFLWAVVKIAAVFYAGFWVFSWVTNFLISIGWTYPLITSLVG